MNLARFYEGSLLRRTVVCVATFVLGHDGDNRSFHS